MHPIEHLRYVARSHDADPALVAAEAAAAMRSLDPGEVVVACRRVLGRHPTNGALWWACSRILAAAESRRTARQVGDDLDDDPTARHLAIALPDEVHLLVTGWSPTVAGALRRRGDVAVTVAGATAGADALARTLSRGGADVDQVDMDEVAIAVRTCDLAVVEADATSATMSLAAVGSAVVLAVALDACTPAWLVAGRGRRLPDAYVTAMQVVLDGAATAMFDSATPAASGRRACADRFDPRRCERVVGPDGSGPPDAGSLAAECPFVPELLAALR